MWNTAGFKNTHLSVVVAAKTRGQVSEFFILFVKTLQVNDVFPHLHLPDFADVIIYLLYSYQYLAGSLLKQLLG